MNNSSIASLILGRSQARRVLLSLFFTNPDQEYFPRQLERLTKTYVGNLQKELIRLEEADILNSRRLGNLKLYKLNTRHPLYPELKSLVAKTIGLEEMIRNELSKLKGVEAAFIYGSFAKQEEQASSDIDLMVIGQVDEKHLIQIARVLEKKLQREINYNLYAPKEWKKRKTSNDPFIMEVLRSPRIELLGTMNVG